MVSAWPLMLAERGSTSVRAKAMSPPRRSNGGAYGVRVVGIEVPAGQLVDAPSHWPAVEVRLRTAPAPAPAAEYVTERVARLNVRSGGVLLMDRLPARATFTLPAAPSGSALVHPHLAAVAAVWAHWLGREPFHAGAFVAGGGVWGVLGDKGAGKSSMLAALARRGVPIVCDDVLVLDGIARWPDRAQSIFGPTPPGRLESASRSASWANANAGASPSSPSSRRFPSAVGSPSTGRNVPRSRPLQGAERLRALLQHRALRIAPGRPSALLDLAGLPSSSSVGRGVGSRPRRRANCSSKRSQAEASQAA